MEIHIVFMTKETILANIHAHNRSIDSYDQNYNRNF